MWKTIVYHLSDYCKHIISLTYNLLLSIRVLCYEWVYTQTTLTWDCCCYITVLNGEYTWPTESTEGQPGEKQYRFDWYYNDGFNSIIIVEIETRIDWKIVARNMKDNLVFLMYSLFIIFTGLFVSVYFMVYENIIGFV